MFRISLPFLPDAHLLLTPQWPGLPPTLRILLLCLLCTTPIALVLWLYRYELRLVPRSVASVLLGLRLLVLALLLFLVCLQPVYAQDRTDGVPGRVLVAVDRSDSMEVADPQRTPAEKLRLARALKLHSGLCTDARLEGWIQDYELGHVPQMTEEQKRAQEEICERVDRLTRTQIAQLVLDKTGVNLLSQLTARHEVELIGFNREVWEMPPDRVNDLFAR